MTPRRRSRGALAATALTLLLAAQAALAEEYALGSEHYVLHCSGCHGETGEGIPQIAPTLAEMGELVKLAEGRTYLVRVPGVAQSALDDGALAALLNHLISRLGGTRPEPPYSSAEVGALRASPLRDPGAERRRILSSVQAP